MRNSPITEYKIIKENVFVPPRTNLDDLKHGMKQAKRNSPFKKEILCFISGTDSLCLLMFVSLDPDSLKRISNHY